MTSGDISIRGYMMVFAALVVLTIATVGVSGLDLPSGMAIAIGLAIAASKATLVALFFMHLIHERTFIYVALSLTSVIFVGLIALTLWTEADHVPGTRFISVFGQ